jgi:hypothetical protein
MPLGAAFADAAASAVLSEDLSEDLAAVLSLDFDAAGFDSFEAGASAVGGVGEGDAAATSFGSAVGCGAGACASAADAKVSPAAHSRAINLRVFITFILWVAALSGLEFLFSTP